MSVGVNVTSPVVGSTVYVPTLFPFGSKASTGPVASVPSGFNSLTEPSLIGTSEFPSVNVGVPFCVSPCTPVEVAGSAVGITGVTVGVYFAVAVAVTVFPSLS